MDRIAALQLEKPLKLLILFALVGWGAVASTAQASAGKIKFDRRSHNFGSVVRGSQLIHRFRFTNSGSHWFRGTYY